MELLKDQPECMLSDRFYVGATNCPFVYFESHPFLNFSIIVCTVVKSSLNVAFFLEFVIYSVQIRFFYQFYFKQVLFIYQ